MLTSQEEARIRQQLAAVPPSERRKHISSPQAAALFLGGFLGRDFASYLLKKHAWPEVERKLEELLRRL